MILQSYVLAVHALAAHSLNRLGWSYVAKGELKLAEKMFTRALTAYEKVRPHLVTGCCPNELLDPI